MKKRLCLLLLLAFLLSGCASTSLHVLQHDAESTQNKLALASVLSNDELYRRAQAEHQQGAKLYFYATTSIAKQAAANFEAAFPKLEGMIHYQSVEDQKSTYSMLRYEMQENRSDSPDLAMVQNCMFLQKYLLDSDESYNYFPEWAETFVDAKFQQPAAVVLVNSLLLANDKVHPSQLRNIWQLTEPEWAGKVYLKSPMNETVNMNFLVMLTSLPWTQRLEECYEDYYGIPWASEEYKSAAFQWIAEFLANANCNYESTSKLVKAMAQNEKPMLGVAVFSKLRTLSEEEYNHLNILALSDRVEGFTGFLYGIYATVARTTDCPYTCALFINYLLSPDGFSGADCWNQYQGYYSPNKCILKPHSLDDLNYEQWKQRLIFMDKDFISDNYDSVSTFVIDHLHDVPAE